MIPDVIGSKSSLLVGLSIHMQDERRRLRRSAPAGSAHSLYPPVKPITRLSDSVLAVLAKKGLCRYEDSDLFFPPKNPKADRLEQARQICLRCPVLSTCWKYAHDNPDLDGVWAATTKQERDY